MGAGPRLRVGSRCFWSSCPLAWRSCRRGRVHPMKWIEAYATGIWRVDEHDQIICQTAEDPHRLGRRVDEIVFLPGVPGVPPLVLGQVHRLSVLPDRCIAGRAQARKPTRLFGAARRNEAA